MSTQVYSTAIRDKTVKGLYYSADSSVLLLTFYDDTHAVFDIMRGYEQGDEEICAGGLDILTFGDEILVKAGIATLEEIETARAQRLIDWQCAQEAGDRRRYEMLKRKFEPTATS